METQNENREAGSGRPRTKQTPENLQVVFNHLVSSDDNPGNHLSSRQVSFETELSRTTVRRIAENLNLTPFKRVPVHQLRGHQAAQRMA